MLGLKTQEDNIVTIVSHIEKIHKQILSKRGKKGGGKELGNKQTKLDFLNEALGLTGSNPATRDMMNDMNADTSLASMVKMKPRTFELRRRSWKTQHCLQISLECERIIEEGDYTHFVPQLDDNGYDNDETIDIESTPKTRESQQITVDTYAADNTDITGSSQSPDFSHLSIEEITAQRAVEEAENEVMRLNNKWKSSSYKVFLENVAPSITEGDLTNALRNCGTVEAVKFFRNDLTGPQIVPVSSFSAPPTEEALTALELKEKFGIKTDMRMRNDGKGGLRTVLLPKNPLSVIASVKRRAIKKNVIKVRAHRIGSPYFHSVSRLAPPSFS